MLRTMAVWWVVPLAAALLATWWVLFVAVASTMETVTVVAELGAEVVR